MKKYLTIILLIIFTFACKKDPPIPYCEEFPDECVDVRTVKEYFYFKVGSYWIYEEENTGVRDSVYVTETSSDYKSVVFSTRLFSTYDGYFYRFWTTGVHPEVINNLAKKTEKSTRVIRNKGKPGDYVAEATCLWFYPTVGLITLAEGGGYIGYDNHLEIVDILPEYTVDGKIFLNVVKVSEEHTAIEESQPTVHYYSPNIGIIKKELIDSNQVWNLVKYRVFK